MNKKVVGISSFTYDATGAKTVYCEQSALERTDAGQRRATRTKTLDGSAVVYDAGFAVADQTLEIQVKETSAFITAWFAKMVKSYNLIRVTNADGVFSGVPARWFVRNGYATLEVLVMEQIV